MIQFIEEEKKCNRNASVRLRVHTLWVQQRNLNLYYTISLYALYSNSSIYFATENVVLELDVMCASKVHVLAFATAALF